MKFLVWVTALSALSYAQTETPQSLRQAATQHRLAGRLAEAEPLLERLSTLEPTAVNLEDLARIEVALGKLDRAEELYRRTLEVRLAAQDPRPATIRALHRYIEVLASLGRYSEAERAFDSRPPAANAEDAATDFAVLARLYQQQKLWSRAASIWYTVLQLQENAWGIDDVRLAATLDSLATMRQRDGKPALAEPLLRRALAIRQANRGPASAEVAQTLDQLGEVLYALERFADAEGVFDHSLTLWKTLLGLDNPMLAQNYDNLAVTKAQLGKYAEAETLYLDALKLRDAEDIRGLRSLAVVRAAQEKYSVAEPLLRRASATVEEPHNRSAEGAASVLAEYADLLRKMGRAAEARRVEARMAALLGEPTGPASGKAAPVTGKAK